jgi:hypothetical protein
VMPRIAASAFVSLNKASGMSMVVRTHRE